MARNQFEFLKDLEKKQGVKISTIGLVYENTEFGANVAKEEHKYAQEFGYKVVADIPYPANSSDVSSEVGKLIAAKPDVVMHAAYITDANPVHQDLQDDEPAAAGLPEHERVHRVRLPADREGRRQQLPGSVDLCARPRQDEAAAGPGGRALQEEVRHRDGRERRPQLLGAVCSWPMRSIGPSPPTPRRW